ncbi:hypothetical protein EJV47_11820 [Hymenobacter gummosus]|uniref:Uncharacterized protein n=1 Tax=Hymenobacter gummosus TaxID=1776032 RepID=A0A3S0JEV1_9BACT|nr:hypothetical protein [Hymenobacter gummosus]RTQ50305.1 hypothetical protein EJV47_11820 [Hymenobacter gummosus]
MKKTPSASTAAAASALLLTLLLTSSSANCQTTKSVTLSVAQAAKIEDSLRVLPVVRQEARQWRLAAGAYRRSADSLQRAAALQQDVGRSYQKSLSDQQQLLTSETAEKTEWRSKARKRGVIIALLVGLSAVLAVIAAG